MNRIACVALVLSMVMGVTSQAQELVPGYVLIEKDTVHGFIVDRIDAEIATGVEFKKQMNDEQIIKYLPGELTGFGFNNGRAFHRVFKNNTDTASSVFAKKILQGKLNVAMWRKEGGGESDFFIVNKYSDRKAHLTKRVEKPFGNEVDRAAVGHQFIYQGFLSFVKGDSTNSYPARLKMRYTEKNIVDDIASYNEMFKDHYPVFQYIEPAVYGYQFTFGLPLKVSADHAGFRVALYRHKMLPEKSRRVSSMMGITYRYWQNKEGFGHNAVSEDLENHYVSILPIGFSFQTDSGLLRPYLYVGLGVGLNFHTNYSVYYMDGRKTLLSFFPAINLGAGLRLMINSNFISFELTPTRETFFFNVGYGF